jgi:hypothetical protein
MTLFKGEKEKVNKNVLVVSLILKKTKPDYMEIHRTGCIMGKMDEMKKQI